MNLGSSASADAHSALFSADGTSIVAAVESGVQCFVLPSTLLDGNVHLAPQCSLMPGETVYATAISPGWQLDAPSSCYFLAATRDHPVRLFDLEGCTRAAYALIDHRERFLAPYSMTFSYDASRVICGTESKISIFPIECPGANTVDRLTVPSRRSPASHTHMKGIISALALTGDGSGVLAAGSFSRSVALYADEGLGETIGVFSTTHGTGVTSMKWSPCSRYLYVASRNSDAVEVWDIRRAGQIVSVLGGRNAQSNQRMDIDLSSDGRWMIAGGQDGKVRIWDTTLSTAPRVLIDAGDHPVTSAAFHPSDTIVVTASGKARTFYEDDVKPATSAIQVWDVAKDLE